MTSTSLLAAHCSGDTEHRERTTGIRVGALLRQLKFKQIRQRGKEYSACCPFHDDRVPSFSMNADTSQWFCHAGCGSGNATTLVARLLEISTRQAHARIMEGDLYTPAHLGARYERKTSRCGGSKTEIEKQLIRARHFVRSTKATRAQSASALVRQFGISRSTAYYRLRVVSGTTEILVKGRVRQGVRSFACLKRLWKRGISKLLAYLPRVALQDEELRTDQVEHDPVSIVKGRRKLRAPTFGAADGRREPVWHDLFCPLYSA